MELDNPNYKIIAAASLGALGGFLLAGYLQKANIQETPLSKHLASLSKVLAQIENVEDVDVENLKERIKSLLTTIEQSYGNPEE